MIVRSITYIPKKGEKIIFGILGLIEEKNEPKFQILSVDGLGQNKIKLFKPKTLNSQSEIFRGNKLPQRQVDIKVRYNQTKNKADKREEANEREKELNELLINFSTTEIQSKKECGTLIIETIKDKFYTIEQVLPMQFTKIDTKLSSNHSLDFIVSFTSTTPYIILPDPNKPSSYSIYKELELQVNRISTNFYNKDKKDGGTGTIVDNNYNSDEGIYFNEEKQVGAFWVNDGDLITMDNHGVKTPILYKILLPPGSTGIMENPKLRNLLTGEVFGFNIELKSGETLIVDSKNKTCILKKGTDEKDVREFVSKDSEWLSLLRGENKFEVSYSKLTNRQVIATKSAYVLTEGIMI